MTIRQRVERSILREGLRSMVTAALLALAGPARADQTLDKEMAELARQVQLTSRIARPIPFKRATSRPRATRRNRERREGRRLPSR